MDSHRMAVQESGRARRLMGGPQSLGARQVDAAKGALSTHMHVQEYEAFAESQGCSANL